MNKTKLQAGSLFLEYLNNRTYLYLVIKNPQEFETTSVYYFNIYAFKEKGTILVERELLDGYLNKLDRLNKLYNKDYKIEII